MSSRSGSELGVNRMAGIAARGSMRPAPAGSVFRCMGESVPSNYLQYNPPADWVELHEVAERFSHNLPQLYRDQAVAVAAVQMEELW